MHDLNPEFLATFQNLPPKFREDVINFAEFLLHKDRIQKHYEKEPQYTAIFSERDSILILDESLG